MTWRSSSDDNSKPSLYIKVWLQFHHPAILLSVDSCWTHNERTSAFNSINQYSNPINWVSRVSMKDIPRQPRVMTHKQCGSSEAALSELFKAGETGGPSVPVRPGKIITGSAGSFDPTGKPRRSWAPLRTREGRGFTPAWWCCRQVTLQLLDSKLASGTCFRRFCRARWGETAASANESALYVRQTCGESVWQQFN